MLKKEKKIIKIYKISKKTNHQDSKNKKVLPVRGWGGIIRALAGV